MCSHFNIKMEENMQDFWHVKFYNFKKGKNSTEKHTENIFTVYGEGAVTDELCQKWFAKFRSGDFLLDAAAQLGRAVEVDSD